MSVLNVVKGKKYLIKFIVIMWVKVDYSTEAKKNPRPNMAGQWAIYTKRHWWNKWVERETYADVEWCKRDAKKFVEYPKYYFKF